jgi:hypothetical protein
MLVLQFLTSNIMPTTIQPQIPDLGSRIHDSKPINFFLQHFKNKIIYNFVKFVGTKRRYDNRFFFHPSLLLLFFDRDPGSGMGKNQDPGSGMGKNQDPGSGILDPG